MAARQVGTGGLSRDQGAGRPTHLVNQTKPAKKGTGAISILNGRDNPGTQAGRDKGWHSGRALARNILLSKDLKR